jgi:adenylate cyclase
MALSNRYLLDDRQETLDAAFASAQRALALDENDAWAHQAMGLVALRRHQFDLAGQHFDRAIGLNPNDVSIAWERANWLTHVGKFDEALRSLESARQRDLYPPNWVAETRGQALFGLKRFDEAVAAFRSVRPQHYWISSFLASAYAHKGEMDDAHRALAIYRITKPENTLSSLAGRHPMTELFRLLLDGLRKAGLPE